MPSTQLLRSDRDKIVAGVCGGIADYIGVDPVFVRLGMVLLVFASGVGLMIYPILWLILPTKANALLSFPDRVMDNLSQVGHTAGDSVERFRQRPNSAGVAAAVLIFLGLCFLANNLGVFAWIGLGGLGAFILIIGGIYLLFGRK
ncbi:MAG: PspC domain-containing protein [Chloroflexi bacterium]|nr:PspC domain-containing protein [Chloroflexota bacterium]